MKLGLEGASVLVTGSSSGIGRATAAAFGAEGARATVTYHQNRDGAEATVEDSRRAGGEASVAQLDLADPDSIEVTVDRIKREAGALHILVNNAAYVTNPSGLAFEEVPPPEWQRLPTRELVTPEHVADAILFLGSRANRQITGEVIRIAGGV